MQTQHHCPYTGVTNHQAWHMMRTDQARGPGLLVATEDILTQVAHAVGRTVVFVEASDFIGEQQ